MWPLQHGNFGDNRLFALCEWRGGSCEEGATVECPRRTVADMHAAAGITQAAWDAYVLTLYGGAPADLPLLPTIGQVDVVYTALLPLANVDERELRSAAPPDQCPIGGVDTPYRQNQPHPPYAAYYRRTTPVVAHPSDSWVEVTHCGHEFEGAGAWFYSHPGSGVFVNLGRTAAFDDHDEGATFFLGRHIGSAEYREGHRERDIEMMPRAAAAAGYDSIQFLKHCDLACGRCAHEILLVNANGRTGCPEGLSLRTGPNASKPCGCTTIPGSWRNGVQQHCLACSSFPPQVLAGGLR